MAPPPSFAASCPNVTSSENPFLTPKPKTNHPILSAPFPLFLCIECITLTIILLSLFLPSNIKSYLFYRWRNWGFDLTTENLLDVGVKPNVLKSTDCLPLDYDGRREGRWEGEREGGRGEKRVQGNFFVIFESEGQRTVLILNHSSAQYGMKGLNTAQQLVPEIDQGLVTLF